MDEIASCQPTQPEEPPKSAGDASSITSDISEARTSLPKAGLLKGLTPRTVFSTPRSIPSAPSSEGQQILVTPRCFRPSLVDLCVPILAANFVKFKSFGNLPSSIKERVVAKLSLDLPLDLCAKLLTDEEYWKRRAILRWWNCDVSAHGRSWKELYFERNLAAALESFDPTIDDEEELKQLLELSAPFVHSLEIYQLPSHMSASLIFNALRRELTTLKLEYGWRNVRMNYEREKFGMKISDCLSLSAALPTAEVLTYLNLSCNLLNDEKVTILAKGLSFNPKVVHLDLSHNNISDLGVEKLAKLMASESTVLGSLNISNNNVTVDGARFLAEALNANGVLSILILSYNKIGDEGGRSLFEALQTNTTLKRLSLASCEVGVETATALSVLLKNLNSGLTHVDLSVNLGIGSDGCTVINSTLAEDDCKVLKQLSLQLCGAEQDLESSITKHIMTKNATQLERHLGKLSASCSRTYSISPLSVVSQN